jgi:RNA polymerase sigma-70 factor (ECF subfamily)
VREHEADVYTYVLRMTGSREEALDLTQDALLQTFRTWAQLDGEDRGGCLKWCYRIAHNLVVDYLRRKRPQAVDSEELERTAEARGPRPEEVYENRVQAAQVREALLGLAPKYREVLLLRYQSGLRYEEIAAALELPLTTVETRIHRAKQRLRERLKREVLG